MSEELKKECKACKASIGMEYGICSAHRENIYMKEELKKEWEGQFDLLWGLDPEGSLKQYKGQDVKDFIKILLAKQQMPTAMTNSEWVEYGKKMGYHDYWKDMTRIALQEEFVKIIEQTQEKYWLKYEDARIDEALADIKSKLNI